MYFYKYVNKICLTLSVPWATTGAFEDSKDQNHTSLNVLYDLRFIKFACLVRPVGQRWFRVWINTSYSHQ